MGMITPTLQGCGVDSTNKFRMTMRPFKKKAQVFEPVGLPMRPKWGRDDGQQPNTGMAGSGFNSSLAQSFRYGCWRAITSTPAEFSAECSSIRNAK